MRISTCINEFSLTLAYDSNYDKKIDSVSMVRSITFDGLVSESSRKCGTIFLEN